MTDELNRRSRLATALLVGPAVTVGLLGGAVAPAYAEDAVEDPDVSGEDAAEEGEGSEETPEGDADAGDAADADDDLDEGDDDEGVADEDAAAEDDGDDEGDETEDAVEDEGTEDDADDEVTEEDDEEAADLESVTPENPAHYLNTVEIPEVEGVDYFVDFELAEPGTSIELEQGDSILVTAEPAEGYEFPEDGEFETTWTFNWTPTFADIEPTEPPEDWEADEDRWYSNVPESNVPPFEDWLVDFGNSANRNADALQYFESDTQVYAEPSLDSESLGDLFPTDGSVWWGYLHDEDWWVILHEYTGAIGFVPGDSHVDGDVEDPDGDDGDVIGDDEDVIDDDDAVEDEDDDARDEDETDDADDEDDSASENAAVTLSADEVNRGQDIEVFAEGLEPGEEVEVTFNPTVTVTADEAGTITATVTVPNDVEFGEATVSVEGLESGITGEANVEVVPANAAEAAADEAGIHLGSAVCIAEDGTPVYDGVYAWDQIGEADAGTELVSEGFFVYPEGPDGEEEDYNLTYVSGALIDGLDSEEDGIGVVLVSDVLSEEDCEAGDFEAAGSVEDLPAGAAPAGDAPAAGAGDKGGLADTGVEGRTALGAGLMLLLGGALAAVGYKNRWARKDQEA